MEKMIQTVQMQNFYFDTYKKDIETNLTTGVGTFRFEGLGNDSAIWRTMSKQQHWLLWIFYNRKYRNN